MFGVGHAIVLGKKWSLTPSFQMGYSLNSNADGEIFNQENQFELLKELEAYQNYSKWQGQANLKLSRSLNKSWKIGLLGYLTTSKSLGTFDNYSHNVSSSGIGLSISRFIK